MTLSLRCCHDEHNWQVAKQQKSNFISESLTNQVLFSKLLQSTKGTKIEFKKLLEWGCVWGISSQIIISCKQPFPSRKLSLNETSKFHSLAPMPIIYRFSQA